MKRLSVVYILVAKAVELRDGKSDLIPTRLKARLSQTLSYPVGAGEISMALAAAAQYGAMTVGFYSQALRPGSRFRRVLADRLPYPIFKAEFHPARKPGLMAAGFMIKSGWYDERWELAVYPVVRERRQVAHRLLLEHGLPALAEWLRALDSKANGMTVDRAMLVFNPAEESLTLSQSSEHERSRV